jgi:hypothetical protein
MDDWISSVYGISRTFMSKDVTVIHHVKYHGRRYDVNESNHELLAPLVSRARKQISSWMKQHAQELDPGAVAKLSVPNDTSVEEGNKVRYVSEGGIVEKYFQIGKDKLTKKHNKHNKRHSSMQAKAKVPSRSRSKVNKSDKFSKPTTFHKLSMPSCGNVKSLLELSSQPLVAILTGSTSRSAISPSNTTLSVFTILLPSLMRSLDCGFTYLVVIGYDRGDPFYDSIKVTHLTLILKLLKIRF